MNALVTCGNPTHNVVPTRTHTSTHHTVKSESNLCGRCRNIRASGFSCHQSELYADLICCSHRTADQKRSNGFSLNYCFTDLTAHTHTHTDCNDCTPQHTNRLNTFTHEVLINSVISARATWLAGTFCAFFHRFKTFCHVFTPDIKMCTSSCCHVVMLWCVPFTVGVRDQRSEWRHVGDDDVAATR